MISIVSFSMQKNQFHFHFELVEEHFNGSNEETF